MASKHALPLILTVAISLLLSGCGGGTPYHEQPAGLSRIVPNTGPVAGGQTVTITGSKFSGRSKIQVQWDEHPIDCTLVDDGHVTLVTPALNRAPTSITVRMLTDQRLSTDALAYRYTP